MGGFPQGLPVTQYPVGLSDPFPARKMLHVGDTLHVTAMQGMGLVQNRQPCTNPKTPLLLQCTPHPTPWSFLSSCDHPYPFSHI